jgi:hypothetical protein
VVTKGDANNAVERWSVASNGRLGRVVYRLPKLGFALFQVRRPWGRLAFVIVPALAFCVYELLRIWRPRREEEAPELVPDLAPHPVPAAERLPGDEIDPLPYGVPDLDTMPAPRAEERVR